MVPITQHAARRIRERLGLSRSAIQRHVERAWSDGTPLATHEKPEGGCAKQYGAFVFLFSSDGALVTVKYADRRR